MTEYGESETEVPLAGGWATPGVVRVGATVRRPVHADPTLRHALLRHLEQCGFDAAPRVLGLDSRGREILTFVDGGVPGQPWRFADDQIAAAAALLRRFHDATAGSPLAGEHEVVCHNDWGPNNTVMCAGRPVAMIDFDSAAPGTRLWDLGHSAWLWLDLGDAAYTGEEQRRRLVIFAAAYGAPALAPVAIAIHAVTRQTCLAVWAKRHGRASTEAWSRRSADWTTDNLVEPMLTSGHYWS